MTKQEQAEWKARHFQERAETHKDDKYGKRYAREAAKWQAIADTYQQEGK